MNVCYHHMHIRTDEEAAKTGIMAYDYLLNMPLMSLTLERVNTLQAERDSKDNELGKHMSCSRQRVAHVYVRVCICFAYYSYTYIPRVFLHTSCMHCACVREGTYMFCIREHLRIHVGIYVSTPTHIYRV